VKGFDCVEEPEVAFADWVLAELPAPKILPPFAVAAGAPPNVGAAA
jgi:hypothetical protein